jgi:hypothetical protein
VSERAKRIPELEAKLLEAERKEEAMIEQGGHDVLRGPQADPRAILGVRIDAGVRSAVAA